MSLKYGLLGLLNYGEMTGYDLDKAFKASLNFFWQAQSSQIYRELNAMEGRGLLSSKTIIQSDKPNKRLYNITDSGKETLRKWLVQGECIAGLNIRNELLMRIFFMGNCGPAEAIRVVEAFKERLTAFNEDIHTTPDSAASYAERLIDKKEAEYWALTANFGKRYAEMCLAWAEDSLKTLREML